MIKLKLLELKLGEACLKKMASINLPIKIAYNLAKIIKAVNTELEIFEANREKLIRQFGSEDIEQGTITVDSNQVNNFNLEFQKLLDIEITFSDIEKIDTLLLIENDIKLSATDILQLQPFLVTETL